MRNHFIKRLIPEGRTSCSQACLLKLRIAALALLPLLVLLLSRRAYAAGEVTDTITIRVGYFGLPEEDYLEVATYEWWELEDALELRELNYSYYQDANSAFGRDGGYAVSVARGWGFYVSDLLTYADIDLNSIDSVEFFTKDRDTGYRAYFTASELFSDRFYFEDLNLHLHFLMDADGKVLFDEYNNMLLDESEAWEYSTPAPPMLALESSWESFSSLSAYEAFPYSITPNAESMSAASRFRLLFGQTHPGEAGTQNRSAKYVHTLYVTLHGQTVYGSGIPEMDGTIGSHYFDVDMIAEDSRFIQNMQELVDFYSSDDSILTITGWEVIESGYSDLVTVRVYYDVLQEGSVTVIADGAAGNTVPGFGSGETAPQREIRTAPAPEPSDGPEIGEPDPGADPGGEGDPSSGDPSDGEGDPSSGDPSGGDPSDGDPSGGPETDPGSESGYPDDGEYTDPGSESGYPDDGEYTDPGSVSGYPDDGEYTDPGSEGGYPDDGEYTDPGSVSGYPDDGEYTDPESESGYPDDGEYTDPGSESGYPDDRQYTEEGFYIDPGSESGYPEEGLYIDPETGIGFWDDTQDTDSGSGSWDEEPDPADQDIPEQDDAPVEGEDFSVAPASEERELLTEYEGTMLAQAQDVQPAQNAAPSVAAEAARAQDRGMAAPEQDPALRTPDNQSAGLPADDAAAAQAPENTEGSRKRTIIYAMAERKETSAAKETRAVPSLAIPLDDRIVPEIIDTGYDREQMAELGIFVLSCFLLGAVFSFIDYRQKRGFKL